MKSGIRDASD